MLAVVAAGAMTLMFLLFNAATSSAAPDICQQYTELSQCQGNGGGGGNGGENGGGGSPSVAVGNPVGVSPSSAGSELPFTGYPLTPALLLVLILLAAGVTLRLGLTLHDRYRAAQPAGSDPPTGAI